MPQISSEAIVLQTTDFGELDRIVSLYAKDLGRIRCIAKSAKRSQKRFGSSLEPFTHVAAFLTVKEHQGLIRLERCEQIAAFPEIAGSIQTVACSTYLLELVQLLTPERQHSPALFDLLLFFIRLAQANALRQDLLRIFELRLFALLGYQPQLTQCVVCRAQFSLKDRYRFSVKRGGIVCSNCQVQLADLLPLSMGTIRIFQQAQGLALQKLGRIFLSPAAQAEGRLIFSKFLEYHIGRKPRSLSILEQLR